MVTSLTKTCWGDQLLWLPRMFNCTYEYMVVKGLSVFGSTATNLYACPTFVSVYIVHSARCTSPHPPVREAIVRARESARALACCWLYLAFMSVCSLVRRRCTAITPCWRLFCLTRWMCIYFLRNIVTCVHMIPASIVVGCFPRWWSTTHTYYYTHGQIYSQDSVLQQWRAHQFLSFAPPTETLKK